MKRQPDHFIALSFCLEAPLLDCPVVAAEKDLKKVTYTYDPGPNLSCLKEPLKLKPLVHGNEVTQEKDMA